MKTLLTTLIVLAVVVVLSITIMGQDRSVTYVKGTREVAKKKIDQNVPTEVKIEGLKSDLRKAENLAVKLAADTAVTKGNAAALDRKRDELSSAIAKLEIEVKNGKALLMKKQEKYHLNGREYSLEALYHIVLKKAEALKSFRQHMQYLLKNQAQAEKMAVLHQKRAEELAKTVAQEKRSLIQIQQRHNIAKRTALVAHKTAMLGNLNDPFSNKAHVQIRRSVMDDISLLEASNNQSFEGSDLYGTEVDLTTLGQDKDWHKIVDQIDVVSGTATPQAALTTPVSTE